MDSAPERTHRPAPRARGRAKGRTKATTHRRVVAPDRHVLYEAAVQGVAFDLGFFSRIYRKLRGRPFHLLREDFCGTAALSSAWVKRNPLNRAWGVDLHAPTLHWAHRHRLPLLGNRRSRVTLLEGDVRNTRTPQVDLVAALNCSYWIFREREDLVDYLRAARRSLRNDGMMVLDLFGGETMGSTMTEKRWVRGEHDYAGRRVPAFRYVWEQRAFNPVDHSITCHIHFEKLPGGREIRRAFTYHWRLWTVPELRDALREAGFREVHVYVQGWDDALGEPTSAYHRRVRFENQLGWLAYIVAER